MASSLTDIIKAAIREELIRQGQDDGLDAPYVAFEDSKSIHASDEPSSDVILDGLVDTNAIAELVAARIGNVVDPAGQIEAAVLKGRTVTFTPHDLLEGKVKLVVWKKASDEQIMGINDVLKPDVLPLQLEAMNHEMDRGEREQARMASVANSNGAAS